MPLAEVRIGRGQWVIVLQVEKPNLSGVLLNSKCRKKPELFDGGSADCAWPGFMNLVGSARPVAAAVRRKLCNHAESQARVNPI